MSYQEFYGDDLTENKDDYCFKIPLLNLPIKKWQFIGFLIVSSWILIMGLGAAVIWWAIMFPATPIWDVVGNADMDTTTINKHFTVKTTVINTVSNQTLEPDGFIAAEHSLGFAINHRDIEGDRKVQESPRITAMMTRTNGTFYGDTALNIKLTCGSNATQYGSEVSKWNITCDTPTITANSSGLVVGGDLIVTGVINMPNSAIQFQGENVLTHGIDPTTGLNVLQLGVGNKRTHYRATQHDFVGTVNASSIVTSSITSPDPNGDIIIDAVGSGIIKFNTIVQGGVNFDSSEYVTSWISTAWGSATTTNRLVAGIRYASTEYRPSIAGHVTAFTGYAPLWINEGTVSIFGDITSTIASDSATNKIYVDGGIATTTIYKILTNTVLSFSSGRVKVGGSSTGFELPTDSLGNFIITYIFRYIWTSINYEWCWCFFMVQ